MPKYPHRIWKALTNAQPLGCSWVGAIFISVSNSLSREGEAQADALKYRLVKQEEGFPPIGTVVHANWLPRGAMADGDVRIMGSAEGVEVVQSQVTQMFLYVFNSG